MTPMSPSNKFVPVYQQLRTVTPPPVMTFMMGRQYDRELFGSSSSSSSSGEEFPVTSPLRTPRLDFISERTFSSWSTVRQPPSIRRSDTPTRSPLSYHNTVRRMLFFSDTDEEEQQQYQQSSPPTNSISPNRKRKRSFSDTDEEEQQYQQSSPPTNSISPNRKRKRSSFNTDRLNYIDEVEQMMNRKRNRDNVD